MATSYANLGGTGIRNPAITITPSASLVAAGNSTAILDGDETNHVYWWNSGLTTASMLFDFGVGQSPVIDEFKWYQDGAHSQGTWSWQGSPDNSTWTDLLTGIDLGGAAATTTYSYTNSTGYRYYRLLQTGGATSSSPYIVEIEFKIDNFRMFMADGFAIGGSNGSTTVASAGLTTTRADDIILAIISAEITSAGSPQVSSVANTAGLTWILRKRLTFTGGRHTNPQIVEVWWAYSPSPLTGDVITATFNGTMDNAIVTAFGVAGTNTAAPWDTNAALPASNTDVTGSSTDPSVAGISTDNNNVMAIALWGSGDNSNPIGTPPTGYTEISHLNHTSGTDWEYGNSAYKIAIAALSSETATFNELEKNWGAIADALVLNPGTVANDVAWASVEDPDIASFQTSDTISAVFNPTEAVDTFAGIGGVVTSAAWHSTEAVDVFDGFIYEPVSGPLSVTDRPDQFHGLGGGGPTSTIRVFFVC